MERRLSARDLSFDPAPDAGDEESVVSPSLYLPSAEADPATIVEQDQWDGAVSGSLATALQGLDERSRTVIKARWLAETEDKKTLQDLADEFGVSAERIRQIESAAIGKLRARWPAEAGSGGGRNGRRHRLVQLEVERIGHQVLPFRQFRDLAGGRQEHRVGEARRRARRARP